MAGVLGRAERVERGDATCGGIPGPVSPTSAAPQSLYVPITSSTFVLARIIEPVSKLDSLRVREEAGVPPARGNAGAQNPA